MLAHHTPTTLLQGLNPEQLAAVTWPPQSALVLAGAGSGKTRVLTTRIAWLLQNGQAGVHNILAVTFTNKAAKEMHNRLSAMVTANIRAMWLGTFHGLCHRFLRRHHQAAGLPAAFQILDGADQLNLIKRLLKQLNIGEETIAPRSLQSFINAQKENGLRASQLNAPDNHSRRLTECYAQYDQTCRQEGVVDFAELMLRSYELLQSDEILRRHYQNRFRHILVDEFQDTNKLQYAWLKLIAGDSAAIFAVGDDDQSIYRFRGAHIGNMADLIREFNIESPIKLEQNYRSDGHILAAANAVIQNNTERLGKNLRTEAQAGDKIRFYAAPYDFAEADFIIEHTQALQNSGHRLSQTAVLYRSNAQSRIIEQALFAAGIPYKIYGGLRFYERQEIKHALAYLRLAVNPNDDNALLRIINIPPRGIGTRTIAAIQTAAAEQGTSLWQAAVYLSGKTTKIAAFIRLIEQLRSQASQLPLAEMMHTLIRHSGLYDHYQTAKNKQQDRLDNLNELINAAAAFQPSDNHFENENQADSQDPLFPILAFLSNAALESGENQAQAGEEALQLMTIHAAKGLEFNTVFLTGLEEGLFPSEYSLAERGGIEEERRLMYVAITRARKQLYISMAQQRMLHGQTHFGTVSRFVDEIPKHILHRLSPAPQRKHPLNEIHIPLPAQSNTDLPPEYDGFRIGQNVRHPKFGTGVIIDAQHKSKGARLSVNFGKQGIKDLDTQFAPLEAL